MQRRDQFRSTFEREIGYSRRRGGERVRRRTTGFDYATMTIERRRGAGAADDAEIEAALSEAGASLADVVRVRYILPKADDFPACWPVLREAFGEVRPAATMIEAGLADPRMKIEIEVTAVKG